MLTTKQVNFCEGIAFNNLNPADAYRQAYNAGNMANATISNNAYKLAIRNDITTKIAELKAPTILEFHLERSELVRHAFDVFKETKLGTVKLASLRLIADIQGDIVRKAEIHTTSDEEAELRKGLRDGLFTMDQLRAQIDSVSIIDVESKELPDGQ